MDIPIRRIMRNAVIFGVVVLIGAEFVFRKRYVEPVREATPLILEIQQYLELDEVIGFRWKPNVSAGEEIVFEDGDAAAYPLSTDELGFINSPQAKADIEAGKRPNIIGVGDSFLEHGAHVLTEYFAEHGLVYRNMAMHRTSPPQFTDIVEQYAVPLEPRMIVYSLYENDFAETVDYRNWEASGLDWFAFHSGTWCGAPVKAEAWERRAEAWAPGYVALYSVIENRYLDQRSIGGGIADQTVTDIADEIREAARIAEENGIRFRLLLIPSKESVIGEANAEAQAYDRVLKAIGEVSVIDLREVFGGHESPESLYYRENGHWNAEGIRLAALKITERLGGDN